MGSSVKSTRKNSWESCRLKYYHKYSGGDGQRAAIPDMAHKQTIKQTNFRRHNTKFCGTDSVDHTVNLITYFSNSLALMFLLSSSGSR